MSKKLIDKKIFKLSAGKCHICEENDYSLLDVHRIRNGSDGGEYTIGNCVCLCCRCHRLNHSGKIRIIGIFKSTAGNLLHYFDQEGKEIFKEI